MADDDEEEGFGGAYEDGHWVWDNAIGGLAFKSDKLRKSVSEQVAKPAQVIDTSAVAFKEDVDLLEQVRFRKRYARKLLPEERDIITLQDVKDIALFTAPMGFLTPTLINLLHVPTAERFIRALIVYCQYYLQVEEKMAARIAELEKKVRTPYSEGVEEIFRENLSDLRTLVAQEYSIILIGGADTKKFHHKGPAKKLKSLAKKDAALFETFLRMAIQITWLALSRRSFNKIELEVNRIFKSEYFNNVEHMLKTGFMSNMSKAESDTLLGRCLRHDKKLVTRSPLMNEAFCYRPVDYRMLGLGVIQYDELSARLNYMQIAVAAPEDRLCEENVTVGILGLPRSFFDTMLRPLPTALATDSKSKTKKSTPSFMSSPGSAKSTTSAGTKHEKKDEVKYVYDDIQLPFKLKTMPPLPDRFPDRPLPLLRCSDKQRRRWLNRLIKLKSPARKSIVS